MCSLRWWRSRSVQQRYGGSRTLACVRTNINLTDALGEAAKDQGRARCRTFTSLVVERLRAVLDAPVRRPQPIVLPPHGNPGGSFLVDLLVPEALWEALDDDGAR